MHCLLCHGPTDEMKADVRQIVPVALTEENCCPPHWQEQLAAVAEYQRDHPDDVCTPTCGCVSAAEYLQERGLVA